jgi:hypothetical protein
VASLLGCPVQHAEKIEGCAPRGVGRDGVGKRRSSAGGVVGADFLADIAAEDPRPELGIEGRVDGLASLNGQVGDAA